MLVSLLIANISVASGSLPIAAAAYNYKRLDSLMKLLALFLLISGCFDLTQWIAYNYKPHDGKPLNTIPILHAFVIISVVFWNYLLQFVFKTNFENSDRSISWFNLMYCDL